MRIITLREFIALYKKNARGLERLPEKRVLGCH